MTVASGSRFSGRWRINFPSAISASILPPPSTEADLILRGRAGSSIRSPSAFQDVNINQIAFARAGEGGVGFQDRRACRRCSRHTSNHAPISFSRATCRGAISPLGIGPTFSSMLPSPPAKRISMFMHCASVFTPSFAPQAHWPANRHARFPRTLVVVGADGLLGRVVIRVRRKDLAIVVASPRSSRLVRMIFGWSFFTNAYVAGWSYIGFAPVPIEPQHINRAVVGKSSRISPCIRATNAALRSVRKSGSRQSIGEKYQPMRIPAWARSLSQFAAHVALKRRMHDIVVVDLRVPQQEAVAVLGGQHHVFHAGRLGDGDPLLR